ncbi:MAG: DMT family transporter [Bacteriovoracaceae bacterium]|nr:DMT family transporter [Bacteriovoracaceae bacterium]
MTSSILIIIASFLWALDTIWRYPLLGKGFGPFTIVLWEHLLALFLLAPFFWAIFLEKKLYQGKIIFALFFIGIFGSCWATLALTAAFQYLNPSIVILLLKIQPIAVVLLASIFLKEKIGPQFLACFLLSMVGVVLISYTGEDFFPSFNKDSATGYLLGIFAAISWGITTVLGRYLALNTFLPTQIAGLRYFFGLIGCLMIVNFQDKSFHQHLSAIKDWNFSQSILVIVSMTALTSMFIYYKGLNKTPAKVASILEMFFPLFAVVINYIALGIKLNPYQIVGGLILIFSAFVIQRKSV